MRSGYSRRWSRDSNGLYSPESERPHCGRASDPEPESEMHSIPFWQCYAIAGGQERMNRAACESRGIFSCLVINPRYRARAKPIGTVVLVNHQGSRRKGNLYCPGYSASTHWVKQGRCGGEPANQGPSSKLPRCDWARGCSKTHPGRK
jgi:hypothetical protein